MRGISGKQFVDQVVDRDPLKITGLSPACEVAPAAAVTTPMALAGWLAASDRREHVDHRAIGSGDRAVVYGDLIEQEARGRYSC